MVEDDHSIQSNVLSSVGDEEEVVDGVELEEDESSSPNSSANPPASLSLSEDSDTARIYDLHTMETRFEKRPPTTATRTTVSPDTVKFFAPKTVPNFARQADNVVEEKKVSFRLYIYRVAIN